MNNTIKFQAAIWLSILATGCASTIDEDLEPREFQSNYSYAYNLANQTVLTRHGSELKDLTSEEAAEIKNAPIKHNGGNTNVIFGVASILSGNLTGAISVAGGAAANLSGVTSKNLPPKYSRWLIKLEKSKFSSKEEAVEHAHQTVRTAMYEAFSEYGTVETTTKEYKEDELYKYHVKSGVLIKDGKKYRIGAGWNEVGLDYVTEDEELYYIGYAYNDPYSPFGMTASVYAFNKENEGNEIDLVEIYKKTTSLLPSNYLLYKSPFEVIHLGGGAKTYDYSHRIPAIYQSGVKHEFIKPE